MRTRARIALAAFACAAAAAGAQVFKWVDENGRTHYGEKPPPGAKATEVGVSPPPSGPAAPTAQPGWKEKELEFQKRRIERERREAATSERDQRGAARSQACDEARRQLARLEEQVPIYRRDAGGKRIYLEDKDRPAAIAEERRLIAQNCAS